jgi:hypothetical protein
VVEELDDDLGRLGYWQIHDLIDPISPTTAGFSLIPQDIKHLQFCQDNPFVDMGNVIQLFNPFIFTAPRQPLPPPQCRQTPLRDTPLLVTTTTLRRALPS